MNINLLQNDLQDLENLGLRRTLKPLNSPQGRVIEMAGKRVVNFCSNDYLGLANDERIKAAAIDAIGQYGLGSGASRLVCGNMVVHEQLENEIAQFKNTQAALVYSSGFMANIGIIPALIDRHGVVLSDKLNHASIIDGIILSRAKFIRYPHCDVQALEEILKKLPSQTPKLIVTDTVFSMDGNRAPLKEIVDLARRYETMMMVDEAHAFGVLGDKGSGLVEELELQTQVDIQMGTLSKAAGCFGSYVGVNKILREYLINKSRSFIYTTAMPPAIAQGARVALQIIRTSPQLRKKLLNNADNLRAQLKMMGFDTMNSSTPIIPILVKDSGVAVRMSERLWERGIFVQAIRPPTVPMGGARLRLTLMATHTEEDLGQLLIALKGL